MLGIFFNGVLYCVLIGDSNGSTMKFGGFEQCAIIGNYQNPILDLGKLLSSINILLLMVLDLEQSVQRQIQNPTEIDNKV